MVETRTGAGRPRRRLLPWSSGRQWMEPRKWQVLICFEDAGNRIYCWTRHGVRSKAGPRVTPRLLGVTAGRMEVPLLR